MPSNASKGSCKVVPVMSKGNYFVQIAGEKGKNKIPWDREEENSMFYFFMPPAPSPDSENVYFYIRRC